MKNINNLIIMQREVYQSLIDDYGREKVEQVNNLDERVTYAVAHGFDMDVELWVKEIIIEFRARIISHPLSGIAKN